MSRTDRSDGQLVRLALIGLVGMTVLLLMAVNFQRLPLVGGGETYQAEFTDASGLVAGEEVRVAGLKVGTVTDISLGHNKVVVTFEVKGVELGEDTKAGIEVKTLLGQHYLSVTPAGPGRLRAGAVIPLERTSTPLNIVPAFQRLTHQAEDIDTELVAEAFESLSQTLNSTAPEMTGTLRGLSRLSRTVSSRDEELRTLFSQAEHVSGVVAARDKELAALLTDSTSVLSVLDRRQQLIRRIIAATATLARELSGLVDDNQAELEPALTSLNRVLKILKDNQRELDAVIRGTALYGREFANVGGSGRWFDATIKVPRSQGLCDNGSTPALSALLAPLLSELNDEVNGSNTPCLPLGPASGTNPDGSSP